MPVELKKQVDRIIKEENYASASEFFRDAFREWENAKLIQGIRESQLEARAGKTKILRSLRDLR